MMKQQAGVQRGFLKCSIRGTNNQIQNRFYKSDHFQLFNVKYKSAYLQLFNVKYKFIQLQLFDVKFLFSEEHIFHKQKRTDVYGRASLIAGFNSTGKMMACYLRDRNKILRYRTLCRNILKCKFPTKGIELKRLKFFEDPFVSQL